MNIFQILGVGLKGGTAVLILATAVRRRQPPAPALLWTLVFAAAAVAIAAPQLTVVAANALGIVRGADLVFYCGILGMLLGFFRVQVRLRRLDESITILTRELAVRTALGPDQSPVEP